MNKRTVVEIVCPDNNQNERKYIIQQTCDFMGVSPKIIFNKNIKYYELKHANKKLIIEDHFFDKFDKTLDYCDSKNVPDSSFKYSELIGIYGRKFKESNCGKTVFGIDIFASAFFMLTRWEEMVLPKIDGRPLEKDLLAIKDKFYDRPIVDEYCDFICKALDIKRAKRKVGVIITHDVDWVYLSSVKELAKNLLNMIARGQTKRAFRIARNYCMYRVSKRNPFDSFGEIIDLSDKYGFKDHFYFKGMKSDDKDSTYDIEDNRVVDKIRLVLASGHCIGIHPSENAFRADDIFAAEVNRVLQHTNQIIGGRQHKLLTDDNVFRNYEKFMIPYDSTYGFQYVNGFRCGTCLPFKIFDISRRRRLSVEEIPFEIMDSVLFRTKDTEKFVNTSRTIIDKVFQHSGVLVLNWHSNMLNMREMEGFKAIYHDIMNYIGRRYKGD
jgi:hypothetical protein